MKIKTDDFKVPASKEFKLNDYPTVLDLEKSEQYIKKEYIPRLVETLQNLHWKLFAEGKSGVMVVLQALDAAGKDEAISFVFSNLNAQGLRTTSFGKPSETEKKHDYLWRLHDGLPARGEISLLNRSYYEEVIVKQVHKDIEDYEYPPGTKKEDVWQIRYRQLNDYERYLVENNIHVIKFFFHVSEDEQRDRLLKRMKNEDMQWEFSFNDVEEREYWDDYQKVFEDVLNNTSTSYAPWYVLPADNEWFSRAVITEVMNEKLKEINPYFPKISKDQEKELKDYIDKLEKE